MSESIISPEYIAQAQARDIRIQVAVRGIEVEAALRDGAAFRVVIDRLGMEEKQAIEQLIACPPDQIGAISAIQAQIRAYVLIRECLQEALSHGKRAELSLRNEAAPNDEDNG